MPVDVHILLCRRLYPIYCSVSWFCVKTRLPITARELSRALAKVGFELHMCLLPSVNTPLGAACKAQQSMNTVTSAYRTLLPRTCPCINKGMGLKMQDTVSNVLLGQEGFFESSKGDLKGKQRVELLKAIEGEYLWLCLPASESVREYIAARTNTVSRL